MTIFSLHMWTDEPPWGISPPFTRPSLQLAPLLIIPSPPPLIWNTPHIFYKSIFSPLSHFCLSSHFQIWGKSYVKVILVSRLRTNKGSIKPGFQVIKLVRWRLCKLSGTLWWLIRNKCVPACSFIRANLFHKYKPFFSPFCPISRFYPTISTPAI